MQRFPQVLENLRVRSKPDVETLPAVAAAIREAERALGDRGRVLVRYSGTEPLLRVMVEGEREPAIRQLAGTDRRRRPRRDRGLGARPETPSRVESRRRACGAR